MLGNWRRLTLAALLMTAGLVSANRAHAGPVEDGLFPAAHADNSYSPWRCWAAALARLSDHFRGPQLSVYATDRHPEIPATFIILRYDCPAVEPAATIIEPPKAPATSKFKY